MCSISLEHLSLADDFYMHTSTLYYKKQNICLTFKVNAFLSYSVTQINHVNEMYLVITSKYNQNIKYQT